MREIIAFVGRAFAALVLIAAIVLAVLAWASFIEPRLLTVTRHDIALANLPEGLDGLRIVLLSDLHGASFGAGQSRLAAVVARQNPQAIVFAGDLVDADRGGHQSGLELLRAMSQIAPVFVTWGNHDYTSGLAELRAMIAAAGIQLQDLDESWAVLESAAGNVLFCGLSRSWRDGGEGLAERAGAARTAHPGAGALIAVAHSPGPQAQTQAQALRSDLMLAGHTHGGQIRLPLLGALWSPVDGYLPAESQGRFQLGDGWLVVTRGLGTSVLPMRLLCPPEVAVLTLRRAATRQR